MSHARLSKVMTGEYARLRLWASQVRDSGTVTQDIKKMAKQLCSLLDLQHNMTHKHVLSSIWDTCLLLRNTIRSTAHSSKIKLPNLDTMS